MHDLSHYDKLSAAPSPPLSGRGIDICLTNDRSAGMFASHRRRTEPAEVGGHRGDTAEGRGQRPETNVVNNFHDFPLSPRQSVSRGLKRTDESSTPGRCPTDYLGHEPIVDDHKRSPVFPYLTITSKRSCSRRPVRSSTWTVNWLFPRRTLTLPV